MDKYFLLFIFFLILLAQPLSTKAFSPTISDPIIPYEVLTMDSNIFTEQVYLGELEGDPHMYEFTIGKETDLVVSVIQNKGDNLQLSLIVVRSNDNNRGVSEIGRLSGKETTWQDYRDSLLGMSLNRSETFNKKLGSGIYRLEVSTADNKGQYMLVVGTQAEELGYFKTLRNIRLTQAFFGKSIFSMFQSSYVYYPIGILLLLCLLFLTWRKKDYLQQKFANRLKQNT